MLSVVVCTHNRGPLLADMLAGFWAQPDLAQHDFEFILVDNASTDDTAGQLDPYRDDPRVRYVFEGVSGLSHARNRAVAEARGDTIAWLDDDVVVDGEWMTRLLTCLDETGAAAVGGRAYLVFDAAPPPWLGPDFHLMLSEVDHGGRRRDDVPAGLLFGLNVTMRRDWIQRAGGFDPDLGHKGDQLGGGEETRVLQFIRAHGGRVVYDPDVVVGHRVPADRLVWDFFVRRSQGGGRSRAAAVRDADALTRAGAWARNAAKLVGYTAATAAVGLRSRDDYRWRSLECRRLKIAAELRAMRALD